MQHNIVFTAHSKSYSGKVKVWESQTQPKVDSTLVLNLSTNPACLTYTTPFIGIGIIQIPKKKEIQLSPQISIKKSYSGLNYVLAIMSQDNSVRVAFLCPSEQDLDKWFNLITFVLNRNFAAVLHPHPVSTAPKKTQTTRCNYCNCVRQAHVTCEYCKNFSACKECHSNSMKFQLMSQPRHYKPIDHQHVLSYFNSIDPEWFGPQFKTDTTCQKCHIKHPMTTELFRCLDCKDYNVCTQCVWFADEKDMTAHSSAELALDLGFLDKVFAAKAGRYALKIEKSWTCPKNISLITSKCWDLKDIERQPAPHAYFEVKFHSFDVLQCVGIGLGNQVFVQHALLGAQQNSYAWYNNGQICHNTPSESNQRDGWNRFRPGDVVGAGILYDSFNVRKLYFTKNGNFVMVYPETLPHGMDCFPGVTCTNTADVSFSVNFVGPFLFDPSTIPDYRHDRLQGRCYINDLPREILVTILDHSVGHFSACNARQSVCRLWKEAGDDNLIWSRLFLARWAHQNPKLKIKYWKKLYLDRAKAEKIPLGETAIPIENCEIQFQCPLMWAQLQRVPGQDSQRFCNKCEKHVYKVTSAEQLQSHVSQGHCVAFQASSLVDDIFGEPYERPLLGMIAYNPNPPVYDLIGELLLDG